MKILIINIILGSFMFATDVTMLYSVDGMMCSANCPGKVNESLKWIEGVKSCKVDFETKTATIIFNNEKVTSNEIAETITKATYYRVKEKKDEEKHDSFWRKIFGL